MWTGHSLVFVPCCIVFSPHHLAQVAAMAGLNVVLNDAFQGGLDKGKATIEKSLGRFVKKGIYDDAKAEEIFSRISYTTSYDAFAGVYSL